VLVTHRHRDRPPASGRAEPRWNFAFWLQNELVVIGHSGSDPAGAAMREEWIRHLGFWYDDPADASTWATAVGPLAAQIEAEFNQACCQLGQILHASGVITRSVGRPLPVLVHELEYYEAIARRTEAANPPGLAPELAVPVSARRFDPLEKVGDERRFAGAVARPVVRVGGC
jgi:hypothetical protein